MTSLPLNGLNEKDGHFDLLPLDTEIFGFPVAEWKPPAEVERIAKASPLFLLRTAELQLRLVSCHVPAENASMLGAVQSLGFHVVDCIVSLGLKNTQRISLGEDTIPLREAQASDRAELEEIAGQAFSTGRYHLDPFFPNSLAMKRYAIWVRNALTGRVPGSVVLVAELEGRIAGFTVDRIEGDYCEGQLACVNPYFKHNIVMYSLLEAHGVWLRDHGIRKTTGRISIGLMQAIKLNLVLHAELRRAEYVLHWHSTTHPIVLS